MSVVFPFRLLGTFSEGSGFFDTEEAKHLTLMRGGLCRARELDGVLAFPDMAGA